MDNGNYRKKSVNIDIQKVYFKDIHLVNAADAKRDRAKGRTIMKVIVNGVEKSLNISDSNGIDFTVDFIGNWGALSDGQFTRNEEAAAYITDEDTFEWWSKAIDREISNMDRIAELKEIHGSEKVDEALNKAADGSNDLEDIQNAIATLLDELGE
ncbi:hypothetical protein ABES02_28510 [Neobacillus pocheonensis]|uniref:hypothetical protein n=1 Tax=Neobacillus pocheonensis TaxID=363869 RepID=UPI003D2D4A10